MADRSVSMAMARGAAQRCPHCGEGRLFDGYLSVAPSCAVCGEPLDGHRADDLPAYLTCVVSGKLSIAFLLLADGWFDLSATGLTLLTIAFAVILALALLRPIKGAVVGLQWAQRMHGFGATPAERALDADRPIDAEQP